MDKAYQLLLRAYSLLDLAHQRHHLEYFRYLEDVEGLLKDIPDYFGKRGWQIGYNAYRPSGDIGVYMQSPDKPTSRQEALAPVPEGEF